MRTLRDLSYRVKVPLALSAVIVVVSAILAMLLGAQIYADARRDLLANAESLGRTLARALTPAMLRDDVWQTYETIVAPLAGESAEGGTRRSITVVDCGRQDIRVVGSGSGFRCSRPRARRLARRPARVAFG